MHFLALKICVAFSRWRVCQNVFEGTTHHHVHAQRPGGHILPGNKGWLASKKTETRLGVSFYCYMWNRNGVAFRLILVLNAHCCEIELNCDLLLHRKVVKMSWSKLKKKWLCIL